MTKKNTKKETIYGRFLALALAAMLAIPSGLLTAGVVYRGVDSRTIEFVETVSMGKDKVCTYSGSMRVHPQEVSSFIPENELRKKVDRRESVVKRWDIIRRSDNIAVYGPMDPISLYNDLIEETTDNKNDKFVAAGAMGLGLYVVASGVFLAFLKNLRYEEIPKVAGYLSILGTLSESFGFTGPHRKPIGQAFKNLWNAPLKKLLEATFIETMSNSMTLKTQLFSLLIAKSNTIITVGFSIITFGLLVGNIEHPLFTTHKIRSILSNTLVVEADIDAIKRLNTTIAEMPEDLTQSCPSPNDIYHQLAWGDFSYYDFKISKFPEHKLNFKVIIDMVFRKLSPL